MNNKTKIVLANKTNSGFTLVEMAAVIVIIGIISAISLVSYSSWERTSISAQLKSDLSGAASAMENARNFGNGYPLVVPSNFTSTSGVTLTGGGSADGKSYCISATNPRDATLIYHISSTDAGKTAQEGACPVALIAVTGVGNITGTAQIGQTLTAGAITPVGATVTYQWQAATTSGGTYNNIPGATNSTYVVSPNVMSKYIKVLVTGTGSYNSSQSSTVTAQIPTDTNWLTIGTQTWAKANVSTGTMITSGTTQTNNGGTNVFEKYCYSDTASNCTTYGGLYRWNEAMGYVKTEGAQGICPAGSHIPTDAEWKTLEMSLGMSQATADLASYRGVDEGTKLKPSGASGLNMQLAGNYFSGSYDGLTLYAYYWSSTEKTNGLEYYRGIESARADVFRDTMAEELALSVRCIGN